MKILQIVQTLDPGTGGVAKAVLSLGEAMARKGHEVEVVCLDEPVSRWLAQTWLAVHPLGAGLTSYRYSRMLLPWLRANGSRFDRVIVNGLWQYLGFAAWRAFAGSATPYYVFPHGMLDPWFKRTHPLKHLKKWFYWPWADYRLLRDAAGVIFTSEEERREARQSFWLYRAKERISPLGIETPAPPNESERELFHASFPALRKRRFLLFLGRLHPKKGCDLLLEAFAQVAKDESSLALVFAGPDQVGWKSTLEGKARALGMRERVFFPGMLEGELKRAAFAAADVFVLPSHQENFGMSVVEALSHGLPVLISNRVNIWREIEADEAGLIADDDASGTTQLLKRWIKTDPGRRVAMRANASRCFTARFEIGRAADSFLRILAAPKAAE